MSTIFIAIALVTAALAIFTVVSALLVLAGIIVVQDGDSDEASPPSDPRSSVPTLQFETMPPRRPEPPPTAPLRPPPLDTVPPDDPTAAPRVGRDPVPAYADVSREQRPTEMFETNAGNFSGLGIDENDERT